MWYIIYVNINMSSFIELFMQTTSEYQEVFMRTTSDL